MTGENLLRRRSTHSTWGEITCHVLRPVARRRLRSSRTRSVNQFSRRQLLAGAGSALGAGAVLAGLGPAGVSALTSTSTGRLVQSSGEPVTFGSNYSDDGRQRGHRRGDRGHGRSDDDQHGRPQHVPGELQHLHPAARRRDVAGSPATACGRSPNAVWSATSRDVWERPRPASARASRTPRPALDGKQYFVPFYYYPWAVHYRKSVFEEAGYDDPDDVGRVQGAARPDADRRDHAAAAANDGNWPQMGMFDMLNLRINGYDFHVSLMGGQESWTDDRVKAVFTAWEELLPYYQPDANGRTWQDAATGLANGETGDVPARHVHRLGNFDPEAQQDIIDDIDFFAFPAINEEHGQDAVEAPIDGFMMAAEPDNEEGAKALLAGLGGAEAIDAYIGVEPVGRRRQLRGRHERLQRPAAEVGRARRRGDVHRPVPRPRHRPGLRRQRRRRRARRLHRRPEPDRLDPQHRRGAEVRRTRSSELERSR